LEPIPQIESGLWWPIPCFRRDRGTIPTCERHPHLPVPRPVVQTKTGARTTTVCSTQRGTPR